MEVPPGLKYSKEHEWVATEESVATIGITDHAQEQLGEIVYIELPSVGEKVSKDDPFGVVESVKAVSDIYAPVSGTVVEVNERPARKPRGRQRRSIRRRLADQGPGERPQRPRRPDGRRRVRGDGRQGKGIARLATLSRRHGPAAAGSARTIRNWKCEAPAGGAINTITNGALACGARVKLLARPASRKTRSRAASSRPASSASDCCRSTPTGCAAAPRLSAVSAASICTAPSGFEVRFSAVPLMTSAG